MLNLYLRIKDKYGLTGRPYLEVGRLISDADQITEIMKKAVNKEEIPIKIILRDKNAAVLKLSKLGLLNESFFNDNDIQNES